MKSLLAPLTERFKRFFLAAVLVPPMTPDIVEGTPGLIERAGRITELCRILCTYKESSRHLVFYEITTHTTLLRAAAAIRLAA